MKKGKLKEALTRASILIPIAMMHGINGLTVFADDDGDITNDSIDWVKKGGGSLQGLTNTIKTEGAGLYELFFVIGIVAALIGAMMLGWFFMFGNRQERSEGKGRLIAFAGGAFLFFGATGIVSGFQQMANGFTLAA